MRRWIWILCLLLCLTMSACGTVSRIVEESQTTEEVSMLQTEDPVSLDVYYLKDDVCAETLVRAYQMFASGVEVRATAFSSAAEMDTRIQAEQTSDGGADVILFHSGATTLDTMKMAANGAFLDLTPMLEADGSYEAFQYFPVLNAGVVNGGQMLMPLRFGLSYLLTTEEKLESAELELPEDYTASALMQALTRYAGECGQGETAVYCNDINVRSQGGYLYDMLRLSGVELLNLEEMQLSMDETVFREFAEYVKMEWLQFKLSAEIASVYNKDPVSYYERFATIAFGGSEATAKKMWSRGGSMPWMLRQYTAVFREGLDETVSLLMMPNYGDSNSLTADVYTYAAIPAQADEPDAAYAFVRYAMDAEVSDATQELPVSRAAAAALLDDLCENPGNLAKVGTRMVKIPEMTMEMREECEEILNRISAGSICSNGLKNIFSTVMSDYLIEKAELDICFVEMQNKLVQYLSE